MKIGITSTDVATMPRLDAMARTLRKHGHAFVNGSSANVDLWLVDCCRPYKLNEQTLDALVGFNGQIILMTLDDGGYFYTHSAKETNTFIPTEIMNKATAFAKIQWAHDDKNCNLAKQVLVPPFLIGGLPKPIKDKRPIASFYGLPTGSQEAESNIRIKACRLLTKQPWFQGGIVGQEPMARKSRDIAGIEAGHRPKPLYLRSINTSLLSICLPGHSVLTYRLFESLGLGSCVISYGLSSCRWLNELIPNKHHIPISDDLSDLVDICEQAIKNRTNTLKIANNGYNLYNEYYRLLPDGTITDNMWNDIARQWRSVGIDI